MTKLRLAAVAFAICLAMSDKASSNEDQWSCMATAEGSNQSDVMVVIQLTTGGMVLHRSVSWRPPIIDEGSVTSYFQVPDISLYYDNAQSEVIGDITSILLGASALGAPRNALRGKHLSLAIDSSEPWIVELPSRGVGPDYFVGRRRLVQRSAFVEAPIASVTEATNARVSLTGDGGRVLAEARYDLSALAERDQLFARAWSSAERLALHPEQCDKADGVLPADMMPPLPMPPIQ